MEKELAKLGTVLAIAIETYEKQIRYLAIALIISLIITGITVITMLYVLVNQRPVQDSIVGVKAVVGAYSKYEKQPITTKIVVIG